jgi:hypothetical protein
MGTHESFGILLERSKDLIYVTSSSDGMPESMGEWLLSVLRIRSVEGLLEAMRDNDTERVDHPDSQLLVVASDEGDINEWTFSEWIYLYRQRTESLLVCYLVVHLEDMIGDLYISGNNPYGGQYWLSVLLDVYIYGSDDVMGLWRRTRSLKRAGRYLTLYK